jgi:hypothetical protein
VQGEALEFSGIGRPDPSETRVQARLAEEDGLHESARRVDLIMRA